MKPPKLLDRGGWTTGAHQYVYDGENRIVSSGYGATAYGYGADGERVTKQSSAGTFHYVTDLDGSVLVQYKDNSYLLQPQYTWFNGQQLATLTTSGTAGSTDIEWVATDWLGTARVRMDMAGDVRGAFSSLPFGEALTNTVGNDTNPLHFTGKERDAESGLDYFGARYYASNMGRWMSPDWSAKVTPVPYAKLDDPQSLNLYAYVGNNPLSKADPDGHCNAPSNLKAGQVGVCVASYISTKSFDLIGDGDNRGPNGNGGSSRIQTTFTVDLQSGATEKPKDGDQVAKSTLAGGNAPLQGAGSSTVSPGATVDTNGNMHVSVDQSAHSAYDVGGALGDISNHVNLNITPTGQVGVDAGSTARQFPALEVYRYTTDGTTVTTTLVHNYQQTSPSALRQPEQPLAPQAPQ